VEVVEMMYVVESGGVATLMSDLKAAYAACDGVVWTDYGTLGMLTSGGSVAVAVPALGSWSVSI
jgi:hypothetical protein